MDLEAAYYQKAAEAYERRDYSLCILLLKKVRWSVPRHVNLLVNCTYDYWEENYAKKHDLCSAIFGDSRVSDGADAFSFSSPLRPQSKGAFIDTEGGSGSPVRVSTPLQQAVVEAAGASDEKVLQVLKDSFSALLGRGRGGKIPIQAYDYIRLSHIYLTEGALEGALRILQLASARGYLEEPLVIIQSYAIYIRLGRDADTASSMNYLISDLELATSKRQRDYREHRQLFMSDCADLPLSYVYLICASFLQQRMTFLSAAKARKGASVTQRRSSAGDYMVAMNKFTAILSEAYYLHTGLKNEDPVSLVSWFQIAEIWLDMGDALEATPFLLLAHEAYWEAFVRQALDERALRKLVASMEKYKLERHVPALLGRAMEINPWNLYCRAMILQYEEELEPDETKRQWKQLFESDNKDAITVQACVRSWRIRLHWADIYNRAWLRREGYREREREAGRRGATVQRRYIRELFDRWREDVESWKLTKYNAATAVQAHFRRWVQQYYYQWDRHRARQANACFYITAQLHHDFHRTVHFRAWYDLYLQRLRHRSADIIQESLYMSGYSRILRAGMDFILSVIKVKRRYMYRRIMEQWKQRFEQRQRVHARITIRFFIRDTYTRIEQRLAEERMKALEQKVVENKRSVQFQKNYTPLMREKWSIWYRQYAAIRDHKRRTKLSFNLARMYYNKMGREMLRNVRTRQEGQRAYVVLVWHRKVGSIFNRWKYNGAARRIQRFGLVINAQRVYMRLVFLHDEADRRYFRRQQIVLKRIFWRWEKFIFLKHREETRASYQIVKLFRIMQVRKRLTYCTLRKINAGRLVFASHRFFLRLCWRRLRFATVLAYRIHCISNLFDVMRTGTLREGLSTWRRLIQMQRMMSRLANLQVHYPLETRFWIGASASVSIRRLADCRGVLYRRDEFASCIAREGAKYSQENEKLHSFADIFDMCDDTIPLDSRFKRWEQHVPVRPALLNTQQLHMLRVFKSWMALFRVRQRFLRGSSHLWATEYMNKVQRVVSYRQTAAVTIQSKARCCFASSRSRALREIARRHYELHVYLSERMLRQAWRAFRAGRSDREGARLKLQCAFRVALATSSTQKRKEFRGRLESAFKRVDSSTIQRSLTAKYFHAMQTMYCRNLHRKLRQSARVLSPNISRSGVTQSVVSGYTFRPTGRSSRQKKQQQHKNKRNDLGNIKFSKSVSNLDFNSDDEGSAESSSSGDDSDDEFLTKNQRLIRKFEKTKKKQERQREKAKNAAQLNFIDKNIRNAASAAPRAAQKKKLFEAKVFKNRSFQSEECHAHLLRINASGVFIYDTVRHRLTDDEVQFCIEHADAVFVQQLQKRSLREVAKYFSGSKLVLCSGSLSADSVGEVLARYIMRVPKVHPAAASLADAPSCEGINDRVIAMPIIQRKRPSAHSPPASKVDGEISHAARENPSSIALHFVAVRLGNTARLTLIKNLMEVNHRPRSSQQHQSTAEENSVVSDGTGISNQRHSPRQDISKQSADGGMVIGRIDSQQHEVRVQELSVDTATMGLLHMAVLIRALENNTSIRKLIIMCSADGGITLSHATGDYEYDDYSAEFADLGSVQEQSTVLPCFGESLLVLSHNSYIEDLRLFGTSLPALVLEDLLRAVQDGFRGLKLLEFCCEMSNSSRAEAVVDAAKNRAYAARSPQAGLSVTVTYK